MCPLSLNGLIFERTEITKTIMYSIIDVKLNNVYNRKHNS